MNQQDRSRLLHECEVPVRADRGTAYPCSQRDLDGYVKFHRSNRDRVYLSPNSGTNHLVQWMDINKTPDHQSAAALERLKHGLKIQPWGPDLISKAFKDFDQAFFMGTLTGNVLLRWRKARRINNLWGLRSDGPSYGYTSKMGHGQARITIDPVIHFMSEFNPQSEMFRTLLHEMCVSQLSIVFDNLSCHSNISKSWLLLTEGSACVFVRSMW